jgi:hypothetical protein
LDYTRFGIKQTEYLPMKTSLLLCLMFVGFLSFAQKSDSPLKEGMSDIDVKKILGEPMKIEHFTTVKNNTFDTSVYWRYANNTVVVITNHLYNRTEKNWNELLKTIQLKASRKDSEGLKIVTNGKK